MVRKWCDGVAPYRARYNFFLHDLRFFYGERREWFFCLEWRLYMHPNNKVHDKPCRDHQGNEYPNIKAMCERWGIRQSALILARSRQTGTGSISMILWHFFWSRTGIMCLSTATARRIPWAATSRPTMSGGDTFISTLPMEPRQKEMQILMRRCRFQACADTVSWAGLRKQGEERRSRIPP